MRINLDTVVRENVPPAVNGVVWLDRSTSAAFALSAEFLDAVEEYAPGSERAPTTGHNNLPRSHPPATKHTYKFADFSTLVVGNYWDPDYNIANAGPISEIVGLSTFCDHTDAMQARGVELRVHYFFDFQSAWSEGSLRGDPEQAVPGPYIDADLQYYRNPEGSAGSSLQDKINENNTCIQELHNRGYTRVILNMGGEDWRGWPGGEGNGPWGIDAGANADLKFHWISDHRAPVLQGSVDYIAAQGFTEFEFCLSNLESISGGRVIPLSTGNRNKNRSHLEYELSVNGANAAWLASSNHYRGDWYRWLREPQMLRDGSGGMQYAFITDSGQASWQQCWDYIQTTYGKKFLPMANSVGDANSSLVYTVGVFYPAGTVLLYSGDGKYYVAQVALTAVDFATELAALKWQLTPGNIDDETGGGKPPGTLGTIALPQWQMGLVGAQQLIEQMTSDIQIAQLFPGIAGDHEHAGFTPSEGLCGMSGGVFTKFPMFHALKTFGPILQRNADLIDVSVSETGIVQCALRYHQNGQTMTAIWLLNKAFTGDSPNEVGVAQTVDVEIPTTWLPYYPQVVRRFSETETTNPLVSDAITTSGNIITAELPPYSLTYFETVLKFAATNFNQYRDRGHFHKYVFNG